MAVQCVVLVAGDSRIFSGSDAGGRAASVLAAADNGGCDHDLGYWASELDPTGRAHPMVNSVAVDGRFVQPATLPYVCAAAPLARWSGIPLSLSVSIGSVVMAAVGAWILGRSTGGSGWLSLALVGAIGPVAFYGTDTWEHAPAVGAALLGTALLLSRVSWTSGIVGGLLWGLAVTARTETAIVALALGVGVLIISEVRQFLLRHTLRNAAAVVAGVAVVALDRWLQQRLIGTDVRSDRASAQVEGAFAGLDDRLRDAAVTTIGLFSTDSDPLALTIGAIFVAVVFVVGASLVSERIRPPIARAFALVAIAILVLRVVDPSFVPGVFTAAPIATLGVLAMRRAAPPLIRVISIGALLALPVVWAVQWTGNLAPQWGGRYSLLSGALLTVSGVAVVRPHIRTFSGGAVVAMSVVVGIVGLIWHVQRTNLFADVVEATLHAECQDVLISASPYLLREGGSFPEMRSGVRNDGCRLLSVQPADLAFAVQVAERAGAEEAVVLLRGVSPTLPEGIRERTVVAMDSTDVGGVEMTFVTLDLME